MRYVNEAQVKAADVILVLDCDVPWINTQNNPTADTKIYHIDVDPLKQQMPVFYIKAVQRYRADSYISLSQLNEYIVSVHGEKLSSNEFSNRWTALQKSHKEKIQSIAAEAIVDDNGYFTSPYLIQQVRKHCPQDTIWAVEAVTQTPIVADQIQATLPGSWLNCGGGGLGWSGGGALGIKLATDFEGKKRFVCQIVGDGTYLFSVPSSVYWISRRYNIPILTIVLNNKGWNAPRKSMLLVHPDGEGSKVNNEELNISFAPTPDYSGIAKAAAGGEIWAGHASTAKELERLLPEAINSVLSGKTAVLDAHLGGPEGKYVGGNAKL